MILCIARVLSEGSLARAAEALASAAFVDGATTAGWHARGVKRNRQADRGGGALAAIEAEIVAALEAHPVFRAAALPRSFRPLLFARYAPGMAYGSHVDDALMGDPPMRSDVSFTVFLAPPESYDGGQLVIETAAGEQPYKLGAGDAVLYPATTLHRVEAVSRGKRLVAAGWAQSLVRDPARREILFDLDTARRALFERAGKTPEFDLIAKSYANLLRRWAEP